MDDHYLSHWLDFQQGEGDDFLWFADDLPAPPAPAPAPAPPPVYLPHHHTSDFVPYPRGSLPGFPSKPPGNGSPNVRRRMTEFWKKQWEMTAVDGQAEAERERNHKHMINERKRREKQKQNYMELHKLLPQGTKNDKNSIVQGAAERIEQLKRDAEELNRRRLELEMALANRANHEDHNTRPEEATIRLRVPQPASGIDSMLEVLKSMKSTGTITRALQSNFSFQEFSAVLQVKTKVGAANVEKAVQKALDEAEKKLRRSAP